VTAEGEPREGNLEMGGIKKDGNGWWNPKVPTLERRKSREKGRSQRTGKVRTGRNARRKGKKNREHRVNEPGTKRA